MNFRAADESTEMLLTDYLEGRLDPSRQQEIDAYLERHPRERHVIEQLRSQRALLGALPREEAPPDIYETVSGQIERSVLLSSLSEIASEKTGAVRSRPARLALAAVVLLSMGLGVVIYIIVSPPAGSREVGGPVAMGTAAPSAKPAEEPGSTLTPAPPTATMMAGESPLSMAAKPAGPADLKQGDTGQASTVASGATSDSAKGAAPIATSPESQTWGASPAAAPTSSLARESAGAERLQNAPAQPSVENNRSVSGESEHGELRDAIAHGTGGLTVYQLALNSPQPVATQERIEQFLRAGGWSFATISESGAAGAGGMAGASGGGVKPEGDRKDRNEGETRRAAPVSAPAAASADGDAVSSVAARNAGAAPSTGPTVQSVRLLVRVESDQLAALKSAIVSVVQSATPPAREIAEGTLTPRSAALKTAAPAGTEPGVSSVAEKRRSSSTAAGTGEKAMQAKMVNLLVRIEGVPPRLTTQPTNPVAVPPAAP